MNYLSVSASFDPGAVSVRTFDRTDDYSPWVALKFSGSHSPDLSVHLHDLAQLAELDAALAQAREFLTDKAARDAA